VNQEGRFPTFNMVIASKIYSDAGIVQISPSSTNPGYTQQGFKTTYRVVATDAQQGPALAMQEEATVSRSDGKA
jgi:branched-chain amino acid transport system substrate-binding protein